MKIRQYIKRMATLALMAAILAPVQEAWGQVTGNKYKEDYSSETIQHKAAKWYTMRSGRNFVDTFDDEHPTFKNADADIQSTHTYVDTLYVKKGSQIQLLLPTLLEENTTASNSAPKYQRWYNYETEGTFATGATGDNIIDLLTPPDGVTAYRFLNGYVAGDGLLGGSSAMAGANFYYPVDGKDHYVVACDISGYTDFTKVFSSGKGGTFGANGEYIEPTLSLRVLYVLVGIDDSWKDNAGKDHTYLNNYERLNTTTYQGGTNEANKAYLEEYNIVFPCDHISDHTDETVAIAREAQYYRIPRDEDNDNVSVQIVKDNNSAGLQLIAEEGDQLNGDVLTLGEGHRVISFRKSGIDANTPWSVDDGSRATILVTKTVNNTTYNIARFNLTFQKNTRLLTQHQIDRLDKHREGTTLIENETWFNSSYLYRTPKYLDDDNYILLTSRTFDYDERVMGNYTYIQDNYYAFPLDWSFSSYAFFDGSDSTDFNKSAVFPEWGSYGIMNEYNGCGDSDDDIKPHPTLGGRTEGYFIYVDASSRPGHLATLTFEEKLCAGSELLVSAWVKSSATPNSDDAAMLFTIYGVDEDGNRTPIHSQSTGQIRKTKHFSNSLGGEYTSENGYGIDKNDWYQVFMSFVNDDPSVANFESYELRVDNNCASTAGGDYYLDEIKVYISKPLAEVKQLETACSTERTLMNLDLDWDRLMARVGGENTGETKNLAICFVDTLIFHNEYDGTNIVDAINAAAVDLGQEMNSYNFRVLTYNTTFDENKLYEPNKDGGNLAVDNRDAFYGHTALDGTRSLSVDFYGAMVPGRAYWVLLVPDVPDDDISKIEINGNMINIVKADVFSDFYGQPCAINADFKVTGDVIIKVDGQIVTPETEFCRGNINNFTVELQIPDLSTEADPDDMITITEGIYFDWFFGEARDGKIADPMTQYTEKVSMATGTPVAAADGISLQEALVAFRNLYPDATVLSTTDTPVSDDDFTQEMYDLIKYYLNLEPPVGAQNRPLVLHQPSLNITLLEALRVVVQPIQMSIDMDNLPAGYDKVQWASLCWEYTYLGLTTTNDAPTVYPGFNTVAYPTDLIGQSLRIGLDQITSVKSGNSNTNTLTVDLRNAKSYRTTNPENPYIDFTLRLIGGDTPDVTYNKLFLTDTDDPDMKPFIDMQGTSFDIRSLPIGEVKSFEANYYGEGTTEKINKMEVQFILDEQTVLINGQNESFKFVPREGYYYTFNVYFEEQTAQGDNTACYGRFPLTMKVVPEYLVWNDTQKDDPNQPQAVTIGNWNYDGNWKRATNEDIKATNTIDEYYNDNRAFVPMLFSKVVIPANSKIQLYQAGYGDNGRWNNEDRPAEVAEPTLNIQYDLMAFESGSPLKTERYRVSLLDEIHFEPGAEMLHAEYLLYNKAWVDYQLGKDRWYTLASPLKAVYAGDFYTDKSGTEGNEYFKEINFSTTDNDRFNPSVYQRGWMGNATLQTLNSETKNVAISGNWSALYNDVAEAYTPGTGFSLKVQDIADNKTSATFRLPKADGSYTYYSYDGQTSGNTTSVSRLEGTENVSGRLQSDQLFIRKTDLTDAEKGADITIPLSETAHGDYYLVGNPFMAHLDMEKFFEEQMFNDITINNGEVLEWKYWYLDDDGTQVAVSYDEDKAEWISDKENDNFLIPPLRSFFVVKNADAEESVIKFTQDMQTLGGADGGLRSSNALTITATTTDGRTSRAAVAYSGMASDDYQSSEDAELFLDSNLGDVPMVYTVAGTMASSINVRQNCELVPLGVYGARNEQVTLRFDQVGVFSGVKLYDTKTKRYTTLTDGSEVSVSTNDYGRYYLTGGIATGNEAIRSVDDISIYSVRPGEIVATSAGSSLRSVRVYGIGGELVTQQSLANQSVYRLRVPGNAIYVVYAEDMDGIIRNVKLRVR